MLSRRRVLHRAFVPLLTVLTLTTACGETPGGGGADAVTTRTVTHQFGTTDVPVAPQRVVAVGATDLDTLFALGVEPVGAVTTGLGQDFWGWVADEAAAAGVEPLEVDESTGAPDPEAIAALDPDLIVMVDSFTDPEALYDQLSQIAPTLAGPTAVIGTWEERTEFIAQSLGREDVGAEVIAEVSAQVAAVATGHPEFAGLTLTFGGVFDPSSVTVVYGPEDYSRKLLADIGFAVPPAQLAELPATVAEGEAQAPVGLERLDLLEADVLVLGFFGDPQLQADFEALPSFRALQVVSAGHYVAASSDLVAATRIPSPRSVPFIIDELVPNLAAALAG